MNCFIYLVIYLFVSIRLPTACDIDLGLVMDNTKGNFVLIKDFAKHLVGKFRISDDGTHLGAITFGKAVNIRLLFSDFHGSKNNLQNFKKQIDSWHGDSFVNNRHTRISEALRTAKDFLFKTAGGMRSLPIQQVITGILPAPCKVIQDSIGLWIPGTGFRITCQWNLDSGLQLLAGFRIP